MWMRGEILGEEGKRTARAGRRIVHLMLQGAASANGLRTAHHISRVRKLRFLYLHPGPLPEGEGDAGNRNL